MGATWSEWVQFFLKNGGPIITAMIGGAFGLGSLILKWRRDRETRLFEASEAVKKTERLAAEVQAEELRKQINARFVDLTKQVEATEHEVGVWRSRSELAEERNSSFQERINDLKDRLFACERKGAALYEANEALQRNNAELYRRVQALEDDLRAARTHSGRI